MEVGETAWRPSGIGGVFPLTKPENVFLREIFQQQGGERGEVGPFFFGTAAVGEKQDGIGADRKRRAGGWNGGVEMEAEFSLQFGFESQRKEELEENFDCVYLWPADG